MRNTKLCLRRDAARVAWKRDVRDRGSKSFGKEARDDRDGLVALHYVERGKRVGNDAVVGVSHDADRVIARSGDTGQVAELVVLYSADERQSLVLFCAVDIGEQIDGWRIRRQVYGNDRSRGICVVQRASAHAVEDDELDRRSTRTGVLNCNDHQVGASSERQRRLTGVKNDSFGIAVQGNANAVVARHNLELLSELLEGERHIGAIHRGLARKIVVERGYKHVNRGSGRRSVHDLGAEVPLRDAAVRRIGNREGIEARNIAGGNDRRLGAIVERDVCVDNNQVIARQNRFDLYVVLLGNRHKTGALGVINARQGRCAIDPNVDSRRVGAGVQSANRRRCFALDDLGGLHLALVEHVVPIRVETAVHSQSATEADRITLRDVAERE